MDRGLRLQFVARIRLRPGLTSDQWVSQLVRPAHNGTYAPPVNRTNVQPDMRWLLLGDPSSARDVPNEEEKIQGSESENRPSQCVGR